MQPDEWEKISGFLEQALEKSAAQRQAYLAELARTEGKAISDEVRALLQADHDSDDFLQKNALTLVAQQLAMNADSIEQIRPQVKYGNYRILSQLGAGGMGEVYLALDETLGRRVALKFLPQLFMQDQEQLSRFEREARAASALNHPNILTVYEIGNVQGRPYIATEYVEGKTLRVRMAERNLSNEEILSIAEQIGEALNAAHLAGLIHRDIKPENIMLRPDGYVKVLDFGLAKLLKDSTMSVATSAIVQEQLWQPTQHSLVHGTPLYMSPEQTRGESLDGRSDLWSLGVTLYEILTGNALFANAAAGQAELDVDGQAMVELKLNSQQELFQPILQKAIAMRLDRRYQSAQDFLADVKGVKLALERGKPNGANKRRVRWIVAAIMLLVVSTIGMQVWRENVLIVPASDPQSSVDQATSPDGKLYWELSETEKSTFIQDAAHNVAKMLGNTAPAHTPTDIARIKKHVEAYVAKRNSLSTVPGRESIKTVYARASVYAPFIIEAFRARNLPPILGLYIAMNETDYHPCIASAVGAKGLFSFMPETAKRYGLHLAPEDERCDPRQVAAAAASYLEDLAEIFGQDTDASTLAILAYNCGESRVGNALAELRAKNLQPISLWGLLENNALLSPPLSTESQNYVPRFFAAAILGENPQRFGLEIQQLSAYKTTQ